MAEKVKDSQLTNQGMQKEGDRGRGRKRDREGKRKIGERGREERTRGWEKERKDR